MVDDGSEIETTKKRSLQISISSLNGQVILTPPPHGQPSPVVQCERVTFAVPATNLLDRRGRFSPADGIPNQSLEPIQRVDRDGLVAVATRVGFEPRQVVARFEVSWWLER